MNEDNEKDIERETQDYNVEKKESIDAEVGAYKNTNLDIAIHEAGEDNAKYGEFISTYFAWVPLSKQKEKAREMENMTKNNRQKK